jgi:peptide deformylase
MSLLNILQYPDPRLKQIAEPIITIDHSIHELAKDMLETMYEAHGLGLAATQVNIHKQLFVMDFSEDHTQPLCIINPTILTQSEFQIHEEGCLSFPGVYAEVKRSKHITLSYLNLQGESQILEADELLSVCIQHEMDHLKGITFFDHLSLLKRTLLEKKLSKLQHKAL